MQLATGRPGLLALFTQVTLLDPLNKFRQCELKACGNLVEHAQGRLLAGHFHQRDVGPIELDPPRQVLLRQGQLFPADFDLHGHGLHEFDIFAWTHWASLLRPCIL